MVTSRWERAHRHRNGDLGGRQCRLAARRSLGAPAIAPGRVDVNDDLSVPGHPNIFVVGDLAELKSDGKAVPGVAPAAMQSGRAAARNILNTIRGEGRARFTIRTRVISRRSDDIARSASSPAAI